MLDLLEIHWGFFRERASGKSIDPRGPFEHHPGEHHVRLRITCGHPVVAPLLSSATLPVSAAADPGHPHREIHSLIRSGRKSVRIHPCIGCQSASASFPSWLQPSSRMIGPVGAIRGHAKDMTYAWSPFSGGSAKPVNKLFAKKNPPEIWLGGGNQRLRKEG